MNSKQALDRIMKILNLTTQKFYEAKTDQGIAVKIDGELEVGAPIYVATEEGMIPAPAGVHKLDDGSEIEVDEEGKVLKIKMGAMPDAKMEDKKEEESIKDENMSEKFADVKMKDGKMIRVEGEEPMVGLMTKLINYDGTLTALTDGIYETENGKKINIVGGTIQGIDEADEKSAEKEIEDMKDDMMSAEEVAELFSQALKKIESKIDSISAKQIELDGKFQKFSKEPAGQKVFTQKTINETFSQTEDRVESFKRLKQALNKN
jgi:hypothetical protein